MTTFDVGTQPGHSRQEDRITSEIEQRAANIPSVTFLTLAGASVIGSLTLYIMDRRDDAIFVGQWAPTLLLLGLYNKIVKQFEDAKPITSGLRD